MPRRFVHGTEYRDPRPLERTVANMKDIVRVTRSGCIGEHCESRLVGPSGAVARVVSSVSFVTHQASGRVRAFAMNRPGVHGDAGLAPAVGLIRSLSAF